MRIDSYNLQLNSSRAFEASHERVERLAVGRAKAGQAWSPDNLENGLVYESIERSQVREGSAASLVSSRRQEPELTPDMIARLRDRARGIGEGLETARTAKNEAVADKMDRLDSKAELNLLILKAFVEKLTGRKIEMIDKRVFESADAPETTPPPPGQSVERGEWGMRYHFHERYEETESTQFSAQGVVKTADGREIAFDVSLSMDRRFVQETSVDIAAGAGRLKDPLIINFNGNSADLTGPDAEFDLDADGETDTIRFTGQNSGFLALDKNGDGEINDGSELFGALTGNGFTELAAFDLDGNGWIDEADHVYNKLRVWQKDTTGNNLLLTLQAADVSAIHLGSASTEFSVREPDQTELARIRETGVYLNESGGVNTIQQVDLVV